ncbi:MAG: hypothetical protein D6702_11830 [Planctomycetota bacterium]|nr:MAG: hypothetical protein D6702_11830 [Planctomycetota bacterium]
MAVWRRKSLRRLLLAGGALLAAVLAVLLWPRQGDKYRPGERVEGVRDTLGRDLPEDHPPVAFREVSEEAGLAGFHHFPARRSGLLPEDMGSGVALGDADGDGWTDVFLANLAGPLAGLESGWDGGGGACAFYRNRGDGTFEDRSREAGLDLQALANGAAWGDFDGDGDLDLFVSCYGHCRLFRNQGGLRFRDVSAESGVAEAEGFWTGIATGDYDRDGDLDLYVCGYVRFRPEAGAGGGTAMQYGTAIPALLNPSVFEPERNLLLRNRGDGSFEEVAAAAGVADAAGRGLGATFSDFDNDGWLDLYVANDVSDNALYRNRGDGTFEDRTTAALVGDYRGAMGMAVVDFDRDQDLDLFITHWVAQENALYENVAAELAPTGDERRTRRLLFMDQADRFGLGQVALDMVGWATGFFDFDNDGLRDLFVVNGSTIPDDDDPSLLRPQRPQLFWNAGGERGFFELGAAAGPFFTRPLVGRGGAHFDYDLDGRLDLLLLEHGGGAHLLHNESDRAGGAVLLRLRQRQGLRFAEGASVVVKWAGHAMVDQLGAQGSYLSQHAVGELAFGLGDAPRLDEVVVRWPDGATDRAGPFPAGCLVTWVRGAEPRVEPLPGLVGPDAGKPAALEDQRRFYALVRQAGRDRIEGRLAEAEAAYREALAIWPGHWDCLYYLGNVLLEQGREAEALARFEELAFRHPESSRAWMQIGRLRLPGGDPELDDLAAARDAFRRCLELNREETAPTEELGIVALLEGRHQEAAERFADAARHNARSVRARWFLGWLAERAGREEEAARWLAEARRLAREGAGPAGSSASNEGDTAAGGAMTASVPLPREDFLHRWRSVGDRESMPSEEFAVDPPR